MKRTVLLPLVIALLCPSSHPSLLAADQIGWNWLIQYSFQRSAGNEDKLGILVQINDDGRIHYIRHEPDGDNAARSRKLKKSPKEVGKVKGEIEAILAEMEDTKEQLDESNRSSRAGIIIRTAKELRDAWGDKRYGDPHLQIPKVFKNWRELDDETHEKIQRVLKPFNDEAEKLAWKW